MACLVFYIAKLFSCLVMMMESIHQLSSPELLSEQAEYKQKFYSNNGREGERP